MVKGKIPDNCVAVGVPCKPIMTLDEFYQKRLNDFEKEAFLLVNGYIKHYGKQPDKKVLHEFFFLFEKNDDCLEKIYDDKLGLCGNKEESLAALKSRTPKYNSFDSFLHVAINYKDCGE